MRQVLVTGGCGFIGSNLVERLLGRGLRVRVFDSLARPGSERNLAWLQTLDHGGRMEVARGDVRDAEAVAEAVSGVNAVFHLAAQVAVTTSVRRPRHDLEVNVLGTFNVLEAARRAAPMPLLVYTSTNKVYGGMEDLAVVEQPTRYAYADLPWGVSEARPLDMHSPYGCSKGAADQYVRDYARIYGLPTVVLRMSCIYGPHQFGNEDQGWLAHFCLAALRGQQITIYGDGKQVRDALYVGDLLDLHERLLEQGHALAGEVLNVGGGPERTISVWAEFGPLLERLLGRPLAVRHGPWRPGDQKVYVSDVRKTERLLGWRPRTGVEDGVAQMLAWLRAATGDAP